MEKIKNNPGLLSSSAVLGLVCLLAAAICGAVYGVMSPYIQQKQAYAVATAYASLTGDFTGSCEQLEVDGDYTDVIKNITFYYDSDGNAEGCIFHVSAGSGSGYVEFLLKLSAGKEKNDMLVSQTALISSNEAGAGISSLEEKSFFNRLLGHSYSEYLSLEGLSSNDGGAIKAIDGARSFCEDIIESVNIIFTYYRFFISEESL